MKSFKGELFQLWSNHYLAIRCVWVKPIVILMVIFCGVVGGSGGDLSDDWSSKVFLGSNFGGFGGFPLSLIVLKDCRTILSADIRPLTI